VGRNLVGGFNGGSSPTDKLVVGPFGSDIGIVLDWGPLWDLFGSDIGIVLDWGPLGGMLRRR
jgi:hypothetical protein